MGVYPIIVLALMTASSYGWFFNRDPETATADGQDIDQECLEKADRGDCDFYTCFSRRLYCGQNQYILRHGLYYCQKMEIHKSSFTEQGQRFLEDVTRCMTTSLKPIYRQSYYNCHNLSHNAVAEMERCFRDHAFCTVFRTNTDNFGDIFEFTDLLTRGAGKIWRMIGRLGVSCTLQYAREGVDSIGDLISDGSRHVQEGLGQAVDLAQQGLGQVVDLAEQGVGHAVDLAQQGAGLAVDVANNAVETLTEN